MGVAVRDRRDGDLDVLLALLQRTHEQEGYPVRAEAVSAAWLTSADKPGWPQQPELGGWVAVAGDRVLGHVALHPAGGPCLPLWTAGADRTVDELAVVSRLFTDRTVRGAGTALIAHAVAAAGLRGRRAVLEVDARSPAYGLYLRQGWREAGRTPQQWGHRRVDSAALVAPG